MCHGMYVQTPKPIKIKPNMDRNQKQLTPCILGDYDAQQLHLYNAQVIIKSSSLDQEQTGEMIISGRILRCSRLRPRAVV